ncbi:hypothetical protein [Prolixibacter sp. SD074]|jgi:hypothetical protein|uniref:hypothetical protein n=1 Tax=Prolixibacter sp. SD074 TaxID=2652391 RepID=UPI00129938DA|nr:hypothetical protein [Prolixibacter sp. SD074]
MKPITLIFSILFLIGCEKEESTTIDPNVLIQGKWEIEAIGNGDDLEPYPAWGYTEYYQDSLIRFFIYETDTFIANYVTYEIDETFLIEKTYYPSIDEIWVEKYRYQFLDNNQKLRLDQTYAIFNTSIYKRIN